MVLQGANGFSGVFSFVEDKLDLFGIGQFEFVLAVHIEAIFEGHTVELCLPGTDEIMLTYERAIGSSKQLNGLYFSVVLGSGW
jgi:hypothetical protein